MYREVFVLFAGALAWFLIAGPDIIMTGLESKPMPSAEFICCCAFFGKYTLLTECVALSSSLVVGARMGTTAARCFERDLSFEDCAAALTIYFCCYCYAFIVSNMLLARKLARALLIDLDFRNFLLTPPAIESGTFIILILSPNSYYYTTLLLFLSMVCCCLL